MDKYTVDLDQVLNDFEYSELTDPNNAPSQHQQQQQNSSISPAQQHSSKRNYSTSKHSINNVFSSLNEYLRSDIGDISRPTTTADNNLRDFAKNSKVYEAPEVADDSSFHLENGSNCNFKEKDPHFEVKNDVFTSEEVNSDQNVEKEEETVLRNEEVVLNKIEEVEEESSSSIVDESVENIQNEQLENSADNNDNDINEENCLSSESAKEEVRNVIEESNELIEAIDSVTEEQKRFETSENQKEKIGFEEMDLDEQEVTAYLETLDLEEDPSEDKEEETTVKSEVEAQNRPTNLEFTETDKNLREINLIGDPGSTPYNNVYINKEISKTEESSTSSSASPTFSEASTESIKSSDSNDFVPSQAANQSTNAANSKQESSKSKDSKATEEEEEAEAEAEEEEEEADANLQNLQNDHLDSDGITSENSEDVYVDIDSITNRNEVASAQLSNSSENDSIWLGKRAPVWIPDSEALNCLHCDLKFTVIKRRHHCRACGLVLCSKCCNMKIKLEYLNTEARVCNRCHEILSCEGTAEGTPPNNSRNNAPNPNNPMEYCSVIPPHQQASMSERPPTVMVPAGVLKRTGSNKGKHNKSVMFCDGIRPGSDLTNLDTDFNYNNQELRAAKPGKSSSSSSSSAGGKSDRINFPFMDAQTQSFIPSKEDCLPPTVTFYKSDVSYAECGNNANVIEMLKNETLTFALQRNLHVQVKIIDMSCCLHKLCWCFSTEGLMNVGQDEIVILLEFIEGEQLVPKDIFIHLNNIYNSALKGTTISELGQSLHPTTNFLGSKNHAGFIYIRPSFQCLQNVLVPKESYLIGLLVHRWETPWARIFPLRLVLRLGAEYRYYPCPIISTRNRDSVFVEIGHTIINLLADFRNFTYTLPNIRGLTIHMEEKCTTVTIPANRYDQVMKSINNSSEHILTFGGNFSMAADSHLVCIQDTQGNTDNNNYKTHAINIENRPRKITGASFIVFNGALKSSSGLTAKSSIVEDGLMIQIPAEHMLQVRESLRNMKDHTIQCGCVNAASDETVSIVWGEPDVNFNVNVFSAADGRPLSGVPSIRVHNGKDYVCQSGQRLIRWTEVFLIENGEENARTQDPLDISKVAESISKAASEALVKYLDLLASTKFLKVAIRASLHIDNVSYSAGSNGVKLPPIYMKSLDNELVPVLHRITSMGSVGDSTVTLELVFRILNV